jgi:hypothetical protein
MDNLSTSASKADNQQRALSRAGLDMVTRMTLEVAEMHRTAKDQMMPIGRIYTLRAARKYLHERKGLDMPDDVRSLNVQRLLDAEERYSRSWVF